MQEPSIFIRIINGEIPAYKIYEDDQVIAILDIHPMSEGHTLVIPKKQVDHIWDLDQDSYEYLWNISKKLAIRIREVIGSTRVGIVVEGFGVPHAHIHLIPIYNGDDLKKIQDLDAAPNYEALAKTASRLVM